ncbi:CDC42 small effector protein 2 [Trichonephila clavipes]|nr:CDC42 small effector protein 2 [Trichonephila clavipes]
MSWLLHVNYVHFKSSEGSPFSGGKLRPLAEGGRRPRPLHFGGRMSEIWIQCFSCCITDEPPPKRRHRIDRSMIGSPTNFRHTAHVGSGDMNVHLNSLQHQMASKGGYEYAIPVNVQIPVVDVKN